MADFPNALKRKPNIIVDASHFYRQPEWNRDAYRAFLREAEDRCFKQMAQSGIISSCQNILDIGSGSTGSAFVNRLVKENKWVNPVYIDIDLEGRIPKRVRGRCCEADAMSLPFRDESFDLAYAGGIIAGGIRDSSLYFWQVNPYNLVAEAYRVLKPRGALIFHVGKEMDRPATSRNLRDIGFTGIEHMIRRIYQDWWEDEYLARKAKNH